MNEYSKEEILNLTHQLTVGKLKSFIEKYNLPDNAPVLIQRVEGKYYNNHNWKTYNKRGEQYYNLISLKESIISGELSMSSPTDEQLELSKDKYTPSWSCVYFKDDSDILFIDLHY